MILTILWEDERGVETKGFGPHELLLVEVAASLNMRRWDLAKRLRSAPKKGNGNVVKALERDLDKFAGPVCAVLDRDQAQELLDAPANCFSTLQEALRVRVPQGEFEAIFLVENVETLINVACDALGRARPEGKPTPDERDMILGRAAHHEAARTRLRHDVPGFDRLVNWVEAQIVG